MSTIDIPALVKEYGVTVEQMRQQFLGQAKVLRTMQTKAERTGRKVNGYTAEELKQRADEMEQVCMLAEYGIVPPVKE